MEGPKEYIELIETNLYIYRFSIIVYIISYNSFSILLAYAFKWFLDLVFRMYYQSQNSCVETHLENICLQSTEVQY